MPRFVAGGVANEVVARGTLAARLCGPLPAVGMSRGHPWLARVVAVVGMIAGRRRLHVPRGEMALGIQFGERAWRHGDLPIMRNAFAGRRPAHVSQVQAVGGKDGWRPSAEEISGDAVRRRAERRIDTRLFFFESSDRRHARRDRALSDTTGQRRRAAISTVVDNHPRGGVHAAARPRIRFSNGCGSAAHGKTVWHRYLYAQFRMMAIL